MITPNICQLSVNTLAHASPKNIIELVSAIHDMLVQNGVEISPENIVNYIPKVIIERESFLIDFAIDNVLKGTQVEA